jgi:hypothetical protein
MNHPFMVAVAAGLARRGIATVRYQFPYIERRSKRPDPPQLAQATVRAAVAAAASLLPELPLIAGGKSFGGRMTSQAQAKAPLARSGHYNGAEPCPLLGVKQTSTCGDPMSAFDPKRTLAGRSTTA